jgi:hypothetical protein
MRWLLAAVAVAAAALVAGLAQSTASAAPPSTVELRAGPLVFFPVETGPWQATGAIDDAGVMVRTEGRTSPPDRPFGVPGPFKEVFVFTGSDGTITIKAEERDTGTEVTGAWQIVAGTGAYESASGHGTVAFDLPTLTLVLTGEASKVGEA